MDRVYAFDGVYLLDGFGLAKTCWHGLWHFYDLAWSL
jgi:hypothetical protein